MTMPSSGLMLGNSCGSRSALLLLWLYRRTAWMKLNPTSCARSCQRRRGHLPSSGERKKDFLQAAVSQARSRPQVLECADANNAALRQQQHAVANALRVDQLVNAEQQRPRLSAQIAQNRHHRPSLVEIQTVK